MHNKNYIQIPLYSIDDAEAWAVLISVSAQWFQSSKSVQWGSNKVPLNKVPKAELY